MTIKGESKLLAKHSFIYGMGGIINQAIGFLLLPVYTRYLTPRDYGIKELVGLTTEILAILVATAISSAFYRFYFEYQSERDRDEVVSSCFIVVGTASLVILMLVSLCSRTLARTILDEQSLYFLFLLAFCSLWFQLLNNIAYNYLRANKQSLRFVFISFGRLLLAMSLNIYLICVIGLGVLGVFLSTLITSIIISLILVIPIIWKVKLRFSLDKTIEMVKFGLPIIPDQIGAFIVNLSDRFFLKGYQGVAEAGLYSLGYRFGALPTNLVSVPFNQIWQPRRFEAYRQENSEILFGTIFTYFLYILFFAGLSVTVLSKDLLMIIAAKSFWEAYKIIPIICLATIISTFFYHFNFGLLISKKTKWLGAINFSNGVLVLGLNFLVIPKYGAYGAAIVTLVAFTYKVTLTYVFSRRYYRIHFEFKRVAKVVLTVILLYLIARSVDYGCIYVNLAFKTFVVLLYPLVLFIFRFYSAQELLMLKRYFSKVFPRISRFWV